MAAIHEIGHGIHILFSRRDKKYLSILGITPLSGELAALSVELLASPHLEAFFEDPAVAARVRRKHLEGIVAVFSTAGIESFEEELYSKEMSAATRQKTFAGIMEKHLGLIDYTGYEAILRTWYHRIPTLVFSPGYFLYTMRWPRPARCLFAGGLDDPEKSRLSSCASCGWEPDSQTESAFMSGGGFP